MKVAILIRGESRHYKEGYALLKHLLFDRFPEIDFRIFSAINPTITTAKAKKDKDYFTNDDYSEYNPVYSTVKVDKDTLDDIIKTYSPGRFNIVSNRKILDSVNTILDTYYEKILIENKDSVKYNDIISRTDLICRWFYFFSQHINYLESRQCLINYSVENDWIPDMVITTRSDLFFKFDYNFFNDFKVKIEQDKKRHFKEYENSNNAGIVFPSSMVVKDQTVWIDDWMFMEVYNKKMYENYKKPVIDIFLNYVAHNTNWTKFMFNDNSPHYFWSVIFSDMLMCSYPTGSKTAYQVGILRPCSNFNLVEDIINTDIQSDSNISQLVFELSESRKKWKNGSNCKRPTDEIILDTFKLLSST